MDSDSKTLRGTTSLLLREAPECHYQWQAESISFLRYGHVISQSSEISTAIELHPLCAALLRQDLNGLSQTLAARTKHDTHWGQYKPTTSSNELLIWWPEALKYILETVPGFFRPCDLKTLFQLATENSRYQCQFSYPRDRICEDCSCAEPIKILLEHGSPLMREDIRYLLGYLWGASAKVRYEVLKHLGIWRRKLYELFSPIYSQDRPTAHQATLLDHKAPYVVKKLQEVDLDPYEIFCLERDDYRLASSLHSVDTVYHIIGHPVDAEMAFDIGCQDVDVISGGVTPLSRIPKDPNLWDYYRWLIDHGADFTRKLAWITEDQITRPGTIEPPKYHIVHWIFRSLLPEYPTDSHILDSWIPAMVRSPWFTHLKKSIYCDGCSVSRVWP